MAGLEEYGLLLVGLAVGTLLGWILAKQSTSGDIIRAEERIRASEETASVNEQRIALKSKTFPNESAKKTRVIS